MKLGLRGSILKEEAKLQGSQGKLSFPKTLLTRDVVN